MSNSGIDRPEPMIRLDALTMRFPRQDTPAVDHLNLDVPEGEIVVLVGPSGCGKTTTLEMINRLVEPTSGRIFLQGDDVTHVNVDKLRRRIGYVIQEIGLFPHRTIAQNIATVPHLVGWKKDRIADRVDELLALVGLDPDTYRDRYPKEISGGQRQRVGVARAMASDPPVMLMDEPFGATDPITRERLQNEFLRIQERISKTIVFVTHDIDEALKMGDRIAILNVGAQVMQYDTPEHILSDPANEFVEEFLGSGIVLKRLNLARVEDVELTDIWPTVRFGTDPDEIQRTMVEANEGHVLVLDERDRPQRWLRGRDVRTDGPLERDAGTPVETVLNPDVTLADALQEMLTSAVGVAVVVDRDGGYLGTLDLDVINRAIREMRDEARERDREEVRATRSTTTTPASKEAR